ncbi:hypothetical protein AAY473_023356 [Plecturocebus cupreus]
MGSTRPSAVRADLEQGCRESPPSELPVRLVDISGELAVWVGNRLCLRTICRRHSFSPCAPVSAVSVVSGALSSSFLSKASSSVAGVRVPSTAVVSGLPLLLTGCKHCCQVFSLHLLELHFAGTFLLDYSETNNPGGAVPGPRHAEMNEA